MSTRCRSCGAEILWVELHSGKRMPIDALPAVDGNVLIKPGNKARVLTWDELKVASPRTPLYRSHFSSCYQASEWRK